MQMMSLTKRSLQCLSLLASLSACGTSASHPTAVSRPTPRLAFVAATFSASDSAQLVADLTKLGVVSTAGTLTVDRLDCQVSGTGKFCSLTVAGAQLPFQKDADGSLNALLARNGAQQSAGRALVGVATNLVCQVAPAQCRADLQKIVFGLAGQ